MLRLASNVVLANARRAARKSQWREAALGYQVALSLSPDRVRIWLLLGHARKAQGDYPGAKAAYERALSLDPKSPDGWVQLGHVRKLMRDISGALDAYAQALVLDPNYPPAQVEIAALGGPKAGEGGDGNRRADETPASDFPDRSSTHLDWIGQREIYALGDYDRFRRRLNLPGPPKWRDDGHAILVIVDARTALAAQVRATLSSLLDQTRAAWRCRVLAPASIRNHSVASLAALDPRVVFADAEAPDEASAGEGEHVLLVDAGCTLEPCALEWFAFTAAKTSCAAAYCDSDRCVDDWRDGRRYDAPLLHPMFDPAWFADPSATPCVILVDQARIAARLADASAETRRRVLLEAGGSVGAAHIPLLLASVKGLPYAALAAADDTGPAAAERAAATTSLRPRVADGRIQVIIQTRDEPEVLEACVRSLRETAARPDRVEITIVDNRSTLDKTRALLRRLAEEGVTVVPLDEPFNWSRANNLAARRSDAPTLLFLNNDTEMLTPHWDQEVLAGLSQPGVGALGAKLLYPDRTIQHAGMIFGVGAGHPMHEGVGEGGEQAGPSGRWTRPRSAAAVTGACLAVHRTVFEAAGGFDEQALSIAFNDVDFCLQIRAQGLRIVQTPALALIHHESKTRGLNDTRSRVAWDLEELNALSARWGAALLHDPAYNPHWTRVGRPFDGYRAPGLAETVRHIVLSAEPNPWRAEAASQQEERLWW